MEKYFKATVIIVSCVLFGTIAFMNGDAAAEKLGAHLEEKTLATSSAKPKSSGEKVKKANEGAPQNIQGTENAQKTPQPSGQVSSVAKKTVAQKKKKTLKVINKILARVNGVNVLLSDLDRPRFEGRKYSLEEAIVEQLYLQEAARRQLVPTNLDIEKQIAALRSEYAGKAQPLTDEEFEILLRQQGFTLKTYKTALARSMAVNNLIHTVIREKVYVTAQEIQRYYDKHPQWCEERYRFKTAIVPFQKAKTKEEAANVAEVDWVESGWIEKKDLSEQLAFVADLKKGEHAKPIKTPHGFQLVVMEDRHERRLKTLQEQYVDIEKLLRDEKMTTFEEEFKHDLRKHALIEYLDPKFHH